VNLLTHQSSDYFKFMMFLTVAVWQKNPERSEKPNANDKPNLFFAQNSL